MVNRKRHATNRGYGEQPQAQAEALRNMQKLPRVISESGLQLGHR